MNNRLRQGAILLAIVIGTGLMTTLHPVKELLKTAPGYTSLRVFLYNLSSPAFNPSDMGDGMPATRISLVDPGGITQDSDENVYISDRIGIIWKIKPNGVAHVIAGTGRRGRAQPGTNALEADLGAPQALAVDGQNRLYFVDSVNHVVLRIAADGTLERIAGDGRLGNRGDDGPAIKASLYRPFDIQLDSRDNLYIVDVGNNRIRKVNQQGIISTVAGTGEPGYSGDGGPATSALLRGPYGAFLDGKDHLYIADSGNNVIRMVDDDGIISTIAGSDRRGYAGDGGPATAALMDSPQFLSINENGRIFVGDEHNHAIRIITPEGTISTLIGGRTQPTPRSSRFLSRAITSITPVASRSPMGGRGPRVATARPSRRAASSDSSARRRASHATASMPQHTASPCRKRR
jgi:sugar lactone lactonase YvrE